MLGALTPRVLFPLRGICSDKYCLTAFSLNCKSISCVLKLSPVTGILSPRRGVGCTCQLAWFGVSKGKMKVPRIGVKVVVASVFGEASIVIVIPDVRSLLGSPFPLEKDTCFFEEFA